MSTRFVSFVVGDGRFCAPVELVLQILRHENLQDIPKAPSFVEGVLNLRGDIIPVVSLRARFGMPAAAKTGEARKRRIIIAQVAGRRYGLSVDQVREVIDVPEPASAPQSPSGESASSPSDSSPASASPVPGAWAEYVSGFANDGEAMLQILDVSKVLRPGGAP